MIPALKAEFRKLLTVRSTYILALVCLAITVLLALYIFGYRTASTPGAVIPSILYTSAVVTVIPAISLFIALAAVLLVTHEYRYNTIGYSLTAARQRWVVVVAKIIAITVFAVIVSLVCAALVPVLARLGLQLGGATQVTQDFNMADMLLRAVFYGWASAMLGLLIALIIRSQVGAIVTILLFPGLGESLLSLVLKDNAKYLPFTALNNTLTTGQGAHAAQAAADALNQTQSSLVVLAYLVAGTAVGILLFSKRDAS